MILTRTRRAPRLLLATVVAALSIGSLAAPAGAETLVEKQARAKALAQKIEDNANRAEHLAEASNKARLDLQRIGRDLDEVKVQTDKTEKETAGILVVLRNQATTSYVSGPVSGPRVISDDETDPLVAAQYVQVMTGRQASALDQARAALAKVKDQREKLTAAQKRAKDAQDTADRLTREAKDADQKARAALAEVKSDIAREVEAERQRIAEERARQETARQQAADAAARTEAARRAAPTAPRDTAAPGQQAPSRPAPSRPGPSPAPAPGPASGADAAVAFAYAQLGKPYVWGAAGPNAYDCSGLTMAAWRAGGKSLPHYTGAQMAASTRVSNAMPGDLAFAHLGHVGLFIGGGQMIHAPQTGDVVKVAPVRAAAGYYRP